MPTWLWEQTDWPAFRWRDTEVSPVLARARLAQGRILGAAGLLDPALALDRTLLRGPASWAAHRRLAGSFPRR